MAASNRRRIRFARGGDLAARDATVGVVSPRSPQAAHTLSGHTPGTTITKSDLEELFLAHCRRTGLPQPLVNHYVAGYEVDFVFTDHRLLVETDSWLHHRSRASFEDDRRRDAIHAAAGYRTLRFPYRQITHDPATFTKALETALYRGASAASSLA